MIGFCKQKTFLFVELQTVEQNGQNDQRYGF